MQNRNFISQCRKIITVEDKKKRKEKGANIANFINIYIYKHIYLYYMLRAIRTENN